MLSEFLATTDPSTWAQYREYIVQSGDTLSHIAKRYQQTTTQIKSTNRLRNDFLRVGQILRIPPNGEVAVLTEYKTLQTQTYTVVAGDTLSEIAEKHKPIQLPNKMLGLTAVDGRSLFPKRQTER